MTPESHTGSSQVQDALRTAASAAAVGAAVGAARAYASRRQGHDEVAETEPDAEMEAEEQEEQEEQVPPEPEEPVAEESPKSSGDVRDAVERARELLRELRGVDAESVSFVAPTDGGWAIGLEVVEVRRIPDSTDVLATYEVQLDSGGGVRRFERIRRYHRSEAARGGQA